MVAKYQQVKIADLFLGTLTSTVSSFFLFWVCIVLERESLPHSVYKLVLLIVGFCCFLCGCFFFFVRSFRYGLQIEAIAWVYSSLFLHYLPLGCILINFFLLADVLDKEKFNVELIVQCIRVSKMPQTHHHALLLLGAVAGMFPVSSAWRYRAFLLEELS